MKHRSIEASFGAVLREARVREELAQEELARKSSVHRTYVSQIERGLKSPSLRTMAKLADAVGVTLDELVRLALEGMANKRAGGRSRG